MILLSAVALVFSGRASAQSVDYDVELKSVTLPSCVEKGKPFQMMVSVMNRGRMYASSVDVEFSVQGEDPVTYTGSISPALGVAAVGTAIIDGVVCNKTGVDLPVTVKVTKVSGNEDQNPGNNSSKHTFTCLETTYPQTVVIEEWTGTWCKWCVRGIVSMEYMREKYSDQDFIGIAVHDRDDMTVSSFSGFISKYANAYPGSIINRKIKESSTEKSAWESNYEIVRLSRALAEVKVKAWYDEENPDIITAVSTTTFGLDKTNARYRLSFVLVEDQVGPYAQSNAYAWGSTEMGGWEKQGSTVMWLYNDVARETDSWNGKKNSVPATIEKLTPYYYVSELSTANISDISNCSVVALLLDTESGAIVNACKTDVILGQAEYPEDPGNNPSQDAGIGSDVIDSSAECAAVVRAGHGMISLDGDVAAFTVYAVDGRIMASGFAPQEVCLPSGMYVVEVTDSARHGLKRKILVL